MIRTIIVSALMGFGISISVISVNERINPEKVGIDGLTEGERKKAIKLLSESRDKLVGLTRRLSEEQLNFHPGENRWSVMDNVDHLINVEEIVWEIIHRSLKESGVGQKSEISDKELVDKLSTREKNFKTPEVLAPRENKYASFEEAMKLFLEKRKRTIDFVRTTNKNLRDHFSKNPVFGNLDIYQYILHPAAHCYRHIEQIEEIMSNTNFPKR